MPASTGLDTINTPARVRPRTRRLALPVGVPFVGWRSATRPLATPPSPRSGAKMSSTVNGSRSIVASTSVVAPPKRPLTVALPPANCNAAGASRQASPSRVTIAGEASRMGRRSTVPSADTTNRSGETCATERISKPRPRDPAKSARTSPRPPTSRAFAVRRLNATSPRRSPVPVKVASMLVPLGSSNATASSRPRWMTVRGGPTSFTSRAVRCASTR